MAEKKEIKIGLLGCGQIGTGLIQLLQRQSKFIEKRTGLRLKICRVLVRDPVKSRQGGINRKLLTTNAENILRNQEIDIVVEVLGGVTAPRRLILDALKSGKHVVTANKAVLAEHGPEIMQMAYHCRKQVHYEASVCAGIPIIRSIREGLLANKIDLLMGILNGTTNYILTRMAEQGQSFAEALKEAQQKGFAEPDPALDISGMDTAHKLAILSTLTFGTRLRIKDIYVEGISQIDLEDIKNAEEFGLVVKLLAIGRLVDNKLDLRVHPTMIPKTHPLASVRQEFNAVYLHGDAVGPMMFTGKGAGPLPTASALLSDIIDLASSLSANRQDILTIENIYWGNKKIVPISRTKSEYYLRFPIIDKPGIIGKITTTLGRYGISLSGATARLAPERFGLGHVRVITRDALESDIRRAISEINRFHIMRGKAVAIRIED
ncbi:MAG: homoserine dehydrogenase [Planctomycetota bacterium]